MITIVIDNSNSYQFGQVQITGDLGSGMLAIGMLAIGMLAIGMLAIVKKL